VNLKKYLFFSASSFLFLCILFASLKYVVIKNTQLASKNSNLSSVRTLSIRRPENKLQNITVLIGGDVMLGRNVMATSVKMSDDTYPFRKIYANLQAPNITFVNLETPVIHDCPISLEGFKFCARSEMVRGLLLTGVDVVSLANNHTGNYGQDGINQTVEILSEKGILTTGLGKLSTVERGGVTFGFLGFDLTVNELRASDLKLINDSRSQVDILVVAVHWGVEYTEEPTKKQTFWAEEMIKAGADIIAGSHPHWVQGAECFKNNRLLGESSSTPDGWVRGGYIGRDELETFNCAGGKPVFYSLGNLVFDQMWSEETKKGIVVELNLEGKEFISQKVYHTYIKNIGQPEWEN
jgi:hypothetical protein